MYSTTEQYNESAYRSAGTVTGSFGDYVFSVSPSVIRSFDTLAVTAGSDTETKTGDKEGFITRKNSKPKKVTMNVTLSALLGCSPRSEMEQLVNAAGNGEEDYLYIGNEKLFPCRMMLTDANASDIVTTPSGKWVSCKMALTFQQSTRDNGQGESPKKSDPLKKDQTKKDPLGAEDLIKQKDTKRMEAAARRSAENYIAQQRAKASNDRAGAAGDPITRITMQN